MRVLLSFLLFIISFPVAASIVPVELAKRELASTLIVLAEVEEGNAYWDAAGRYIRTPYFLKVSAVLKGNIPDSQLVLVALGGTLSEEAMVVSHSMKLTSGDAGCFLLKSAPSSALPASSQMNQLTCCLPVAGPQGGLLLQDGSYHDPLWGADYSERELFRALGVQQAVKPDGSPYLPQNLEATPFSGQRTITSVRTVSNGRQVAGTIEGGDVLIISGSGFGANRGRVRFSNADDGGRTTLEPPQPTDYLSWSDSEIRVRIPFSAGSGTVSVFTSNGLPAGTTPLTIEWAVTSIYSDFSEFSSDTRQRIELVAINAGEGYRFRYTLDFLLNCDAVNAFQRGFARWKNAIAVNYDLDCVFANSIRGADGIPTIAFSDSLPMGILGQTASFFAGQATAACNQAQTFWYLSDVDMRFANRPGNLSWNFGPQNATFLNFDFESVVVHELGHAKGLAHIIDDGEIMHFSISNGQTLRDIDGSEIPAVAHKLGHSTQVNCINTPAPIRATSDRTLRNCGFCPTVSNSTQVTPQLPKVVSSGAGTYLVKLPKEIPTAEISLIQVNGKIVWKATRTDGASLPDMPAGIYLYQLVTKKQEAYWGRLLYGTD
ncbi:MAG: matrixin family metalloprotease [Bacteroidota bacterium]